LRSAPAGLYEYDPAKEFLHLFPTHRFVAGGDRAGDVYEWTRSALAISAAHLPYSPGPPPGVRLSRCSGPWVENERVPRAGPVGGPPSLWPNWMRTKSPGLRHLRLLPEAFGVERATARAARALFITFIFGLIDIVGEGICQPRWPVFLAVESPITKMAGRCCGEGGTQANRQAARIEPEVHSDGSLTRALCRLATHLVGRELANGSGSPGRRTRVSTRYFAIGN